MENNIKEVVGAQGGQINQTTDTSKATKPVESKMRQIIIETDGDDIRIVKAETSGRIELIAVLQNVIGYIGAQK